MSGDTLRCEDVTVCYGRTPAVHHLTAELACGTMVALMGPNGAGKSTLLRAILGWQRLTTGRITVAGMPASAAQHRIGYLPQRTMVDWDFPVSVRDVVDMGLFQRRGPFAAVTSDDQRVVDGALEEMGLTHLQDRHIAALSGGQQQRTLLARTVVSGADIVLLDEPFIGLDPVSVADLIRRLHTWAAQGRLVIAAIHDIGLARLHFHQALLLKTHVIAAGPVADALNDRHLAAAYGPDYAFLLGSSAIPPTPDPAEPAPVGAVIHDHATHHAAQHKH
jgi:ABC-type Mn2+/Zn2+ transport system ATPase subunit